MRVIDALSLPISHLMQLAQPNMTIEEGRRLAQELLRDRRRAERMQQQVDELSNALSLVDVTKDPEILQELRKIIAERQSGDRDAE